MPSYEYKVVPAPSRPEKARGARSTAEKFALSMTGFMNDFGRHGWEYVRAETLPCEERKGWFGRTETSFQTMLVFRRTVEDDALPEPEVRSEKVVRRLWGRQPEVTAPAAPVAPVAPVAVRTVAAPVEPTPAKERVANAPPAAPAAAAAQAPRIFASLPERPADRE